MYGHTCRVSGHAGPQKVHTAVSSARSPGVEPRSYGPPLTARSVVASVLLGTEPPVMAARGLVRAGELFGISEGTVRTALSRMSAAGELERTPEGRYRLVGHLAERQQRQLASRRAEVSPWNGNWELWLVVARSRPAEQRAALRRAAQRLRLAEAREGVWLRPDNLPRGARSETDRRVVESQAMRMVVQPDDDDRLVTELWDLEGWNSTAHSLRRGMHDLTDRLIEDDTTALQPGFVLAAAVLRHLNADPLLPDELRIGTVGRADEARSLRRDYEAYDAAYRSLLSRWLRS